MPYKRGFKNPFRTEYEILNVQEIERLGLTSPITPESLFERGLIENASSLVKILGDGELAGAFTIRAHKFSASAKAKIEAAGGVAEVIE
jgi:large subunit ribosomal protein L15